MCKWNRQCRYLLYCFFSLVLYLVHDPLWAAGQDIGPPQETITSGWGRFTDFVVGQTADDTIYLGMWSYHFIDNEDDYETTHNLVALTYRGIFLGTFENSLDDRTWGAGVQRDMYRTELGIFSMEIGYRLGLLYGYDSMQVADTGLFPLLQVYSDLHYEHVGVQLAWAGSTVTAGFFFRF
jgi:hypothetical protein